MVGLDQDQVRRGASALLKHIKNSAVGKSTLIEDEGEVVLAQISLHKIPGDVSAKPIPIAIPHSLRKQEDCDMCLIVKDNAKAWIKETLENEPMEGLTKVIETGRDCRFYRTLSLSSLSFSLSRSRGGVLSAWKQPRLLNTNNLMSPLYVESGR